MERMLKMYNSNEVYLVEKIITELDTLLHSSSFLNFNFDVLDFEKLESALVVLKCIKEEFVKNE